MVAAKAATSRSMRARSRLRYRQRPWGLHLLRPSAPILPLRPRVQTSHSRNGRAAASRLAPHRRQANRRRLADDADEPARLRNRSTMSLPLPPQTTTTANRSESRAGRYARRRARGRSQTRKNLRSDRSGSAGSRLAVRRRAARPAAPGARPDEPKAAGTRRARPTRPEFTPLARSSATPACGSGRG